MRFKEWLKNCELNEVGTSTASVAVFARPVGPHVRRIWPPMFDNLDKPVKKKKKKRKKD